MANTLGLHNPWRYRGYVYDPETALYYLQSRYYDPNIGRFLNADAFVSTGQDFVGNNTFAYCGNNAVNYSDESGMIAVPFAFIENDTVVDGTIITVHEDVTVHISTTDSSLVGTIGSYSNLKAMTRGTGLEVHHIVEYRFAAVPKMPSAVGEYRNAPCVVLTRTQHQLFTNYARREIPYGSNYDSYSAKAIRDMCKLMYLSEGALGGDRFVEIIENMFE